MKRIDKLILQSFFGPFFLTFLVVTFIFLMIHLLKYFKDLIGKDLGWDVWAQLLGYFSVFMIPTAMPLAVLLATLMTFGNLGEHFELTAIKSLGISLVRSMIPILAVVVCLTLAAFAVNNFLVPKAALEAYSLLWDVRQKKPALDMADGAFYNGLPDVSIKIEHKIQGTNRFKGIIIYDHRAKFGNKDVTIADSGRMYTILNNSYLKMELFNGSNYQEGTSNEIGRSSSETIQKTRFDKSEIVFDLSSFSIKRTDKKFFQSNRIMRNMSELNLDMDSTRTYANLEKLNAFYSHKTFFSYFKPAIPETKEVLAYKAERDSLQARKNKQMLLPTDGIPSSPPETSAQPSALLPETPTVAAILPEWKKKADSIFQTPYTEAEVSRALGNARMIKSQLLNNNSSIKNFQNEYIVYDIQWHRILSNSLACLCMFLIGAPLGAIIRKGGLGAPVLISILFFIIYYVLNILGEKKVKDEDMGIFLGVWGSNIVLFLIGTLFLYQAKRDVKLFDRDFYAVMLDRVKNWMARNG